MTSFKPRSSRLPRTAAALAVLTACLTAGAAGVAVAGSSAGNIPAVTVTYGDLNLDSAQGSAALYARIAAAARTVCATPEDIRDLGALATARTCERQAVARAVRLVNSPRLAAVYDAHLRHG
jgi:UrcA family protein